jgi:hypothetical protein
MIFKNDIKLLKIIKSTTPTLPNDFYDWNEIFQICTMAKTEYLVSLRNLHENGLISFGDKSQTAFRLEAPGIYFKEFQLQKAKQYVMEKLIDFLAVVVAVIALIISMFYQ